MKNNNDELEIFDFITKSFEEDEYEKVESYLKNCKSKIQELQAGKKLHKQEQEILDDIICIDDYSIIKWAAQNSDIEALLLLKNYISPKALCEAISHNNFEAFNKFVADNRSLSLLDSYDENLFKEGLKFFSDCCLEIVNSDEKSDTIDNFHQAINNNIKIHAEINEDITQQLSGLESELITDN
jgi:hypothetical protein